MGTCRVDLELQVRLSLCGGCGKTSRVSRRQPEINGRRLCGEFPECRVQYKLASYPGSQGLTATGAAPASLRPPPVHRERRVLPGKSAVESHCVGVDVVVGSVTVALVRPVQRVVPVPSSSGSVIVRPSSTPIVVSAVAALGNDGLAKGLPEKIPACFKSRVQKTLKRTYLLSFFSAFQSGLVDFPFDLSEASHDMVSKKDFVWKHTSNRVQLRPRASDLRSTLPCRSKAPPAEIPCRPIPQTPFRPPPGADPPSRRVPRHCQGSLSGTTENESLVGGRPRQFTLPQTLTKILWTARWLARNRNRLQTSASLSSSLACGVADDRAEPPIYRRSRCAR